MNAQDHCAIETYRPSLTCAECTAPGDSCVQDLLECSTDTGALGGTVSVGGVADPPVNDVASPTLGGLFCLPATGSAAVNTASGYPGLGRLTLPATAIFE